MMKQRADNRGLVPLVMGTFHVQCISSDESPWTIVKLDEFALILDDARQVIRCTMMVLNAVAFHRNYYQL